MHFPPTHSINPESNQTGFYTETLIPTLKHSKIWEFSSYHQTIPNTPKKLPAPWLFANKVFEISIEKDPPHATILSFLEPIKDSTHTL